MPSASPRLIVVQLNEVNFDLVEKYLARSPLPAFRRLMAEYKRVETFAEDSYSNLEPWIQWVSAHSGKTFGEHAIHRLGDGAHSSLPQVFGLLEQKGLRVGALSPMNARNDLRHPAYFVPDPWTGTTSDDSGFSKRLTVMLRQTVNENAQGRISRQSLLTLAETVLRSFSPRGTARLMRLIARSKGRHWYKALVLDQLIHLVHRYQLRRTRPDVSFVFLNAGAHIQHHYFFNSPFAGKESQNPAWYVPAQADPILDMLVAYDDMLADYLAMADSGTQVILATGLTQLPYDRVKFYYRLKDHVQFLNLLGLRPVQVLPRMTRDFEVLFTDRAAAEQAIRVLSSVTMERNGTLLFKEIDDRGLGIFVTLTYPTEVLAGDAVLFDGGRITDLASHVAFVAIKNGMHSTKGFAFFSPGTPARLPTQPVHVASLFQLTFEAAGV